MVNRDGVDYCICLDPFIPELLKPVFDSTLSLEPFMCLAGIARSEGRLAKNVGVRLNLLGICFGSFIQGLSKEKEAIPFSRTTTDAEKSDLGFLFFFGLQLFSPLTLFSAPCHHGEKRYFISLLKDRLPAG